MVKKKNNFDLKFNFRNNFIYLFLFLLIFIFGGILVYASSNPGHHYSELDLGPIEIFENNVVFGEKLNASWFCVGASGTQCKFDFNNLNLDKWEKTSSGNSIYYTSGNVGIGTTSPQMDFHINGMMFNNFRASPWFTNNLIFGNRFVFHPRHNNNYDYLGITTFSNNLPSPEKGIFLRRDSGNVGIGKTNPSATLDVKGSLNSSGLCLGNLRYLEMADCRESLDELGLWGKHGNDIFLSKGTVTLGSILRRYDIPYGILNVEGEMRIRDGNQKEGEILVIVDDEGRTEFRNKRVPIEVKVTSFYSGFWRHLGTNGNLGGYNSINDWIQDNGCEGYHVCTADEIISWVSYGNTKLFDLGSTLKSHCLYGCWINSGLDAGYKTISGLHGVEFDHHSINDCNSWTSSSGLNYGLIWKGGNPWETEKIALGACNQDFPVLCCL